MRSPTQMSAPEISMRSAAEVCANSRIFAPGREIFRCLIHQPLGIGRDDNSIGSPTVVACFQDVAQIRAFAGRLRRRPNCEESARRKGMVSEADDGRSRARWQAS